MNIAICDDDKHLCGQVKELILHHFPYPQLPAVDIHENGVELLAACQQRGQPYDLLLLDIEMPLQNGIHAALELRRQDRQAVIMFLTWHKKYAYAAYCVHPYTFILKPVKEAEFAQEFQAACAVSQQKLAECLLLETKRERRLIPLNEIILVQSRQHENIIVTEAGKYTQWQPLKKLVAALHGKGFYQPHKSYLINLAKVRAYDPANRIVVMCDGSILPVSKKRPDFWQAVAAYRNRCNG